MIADTCSMDYAQSEYLNSDSESESPPEVEPEEVRCMICEAKLAQNEFKIRQHISVEHFPTYEVYSCPKCQRKFFTEKLLHLQILNGLLPCCQNVPVNQVIRSGDFCEINEAAQNMIYHHTQVMSTTSNDSDLAMLIDHMQTCITRYTPLLPPPPYSNPEPIPFVAPSNAVEQSVPAEHTSNEYVVSAPPAISSSDYSKISDAEPMQETVREPIVQNVAAPCVVSIIQQNLVQPAQSVAPKSVAPKSVAPKPPSANISETLPVFINCRECGAAVLTPPVATRRSLITCGQEHLFKYHNPINPITNRLQWAKKISVATDPIAQFLPELVQADGPTKPPPIGSLVHFNSEHVNEEAVESEEFTCSYCTDSTLMNVGVHTSGDSEIVKHCQAHADEMSVSLTNELFWQWIPQAAGNPDLQQLASTPQSAPSADAPVIAPGPPPCQVAQTVGPPDQKPYVCGLHIDANVCPVHCNTFEELKFHMFDHFVCPVFKCPNASCHYVFNDFDRELEPHQNVIHQRKIDFRRVLNPKIDSNTARNSLNILKHLSCRSRDTDDLEKVDKIKNALGKVL